MSRAQALQGGVERIFERWQWGESGKGAASRAGLAPVAVLCLILSGGGLELRGQDPAAQGAIPSPSDPLLITSHADPATLGDLYAEIDDPANGDRWLLVRNKENPAGPGRLLRIPKGEQLAELPSLGYVRAFARPAAQLVKLPPPVIRNGERITVEEHTAVADLQMEALAMGPAQLGARFYARLSVGGSILQVEAIAPGRARLANEGEALR